MIKINITDAGGYVLETIAVECAAGTEIATAKAVVETIERKHEMIEED
jgi:hypothetical protein